jgi:hypothetical protein
MDVAKMEQKMRSLMITATLAGLCLTAPLGAAFAGPQDQHSVKIEGARHHVGPQSHGYDRVIGQTKPDSSSTDATALPAYLATLRKLHAADGHIEPQD